MKKILIVLLFLFPLSVHAAVSYDSDPFCRGNAVYVDKIFPGCDDCGFDKKISDCPNGCKNGACIACDVEACQSKDGYYGSQQCSGIDIERTYRNYECEGGSCEYTEIETIVDTCSFGTCRSGKCQVCNIQECDEKDGYYGGSFCSSDTKVAKEYRDYSCNGAVCDFSKRDLTINTCAKESCSNGKCETCDVEACDKKDDYTGKIFCEKGHLKREFRDYTCSDKDFKCSSDTETRIVERCEFGCTDNECIQSCDVQKCDAKDDFVGDRYCKNNNVYRIYEDYSCKGKLVCGSEQIETKIEFCQFGCENGRCRTAENAQTCPNTCDGSIWKYGGILKNNACEYTEQTNCGALDGNYGTRYCENGKTYIETRSYSCVVNGCQFTSTPLKVSDTCEIEGGFEEKTKTFEFEVNTLTNSFKESRFDSVTVFNGFLFSNGEIEIEAVKAGELSLEIFEKNDLGNLIIKINGNTIINDKFNTGNHKIQIEEAGTIRIETSSSGFIFWTPSKYRFSNIIFKYPEQVYEDNFEFELENEYVRFTSGQIISDASVKINSNSVAKNIQKNILKQGTNKVNAISETPTTVKININYAE